LAKHFNLAKFDEMSAIFGLGRSGLAVAKAMVARGETVQIFDEKSESTIPKPELISEAKAIGAELILGLPFPTSLDSETLVVNPAIDHRHPTLQVLLRTGVEILSEVEYAYRISKAPIIAVTGTNGKSTTVALIATTLQKLGIDAVLCGNIFGSGLAEMPLTEAADRSSPDQVLVAEVSSFQLEWISTFRPIVSIITSISPDHLDRYDGYEDYVTTKWKMSFAQTQEELLLIGPDVLIRDTKAELIQVAEASNFSENDLKMIGKHNVFNTELAYIACMRYLERCSPEISRNELKSIIAHFPGIAHRMEFVCETEGIRFVNNSMCTNPGAVISSLKSISGPTHTLIGGVNKELDFSPLADYLLENPQPVYLYGRDALQIADVLRKKCPINLPVYSTMKEAFGAASNAAQKGDTVMLAPGCASMDQFSDFRHRGDVFRQLAKDWHHEHSQEDS
jgi:UDP-N-acetylmuramoylalanine--D-glutamate ligase